MIRKIIFSVFLSAFFIHAQNTGDYQLAKIYDLLKSSYFDTTLCSVSIHDLTDRQELFSYNEDQLLHPASNMKIITTAAALYFLGPEYSFTTSVYYSGRIEDSILKGDLYFIGGLDPDLSYDDLDTLAQKIAQSGIKKIEGNIYGDVSNSDSLYWGQGWMWDDDPGTDFPYMTSLIVDDAAVKIGIEPGKENEPVIAHIIPENNYFKIFNNSTTTETEYDKFLVTRDWQNDNNRILISGKLPVSFPPDTISLNIKNPEKYFVYLAQKALGENGIEISGGNSIKCLSDTNAVLLAEKKRSFGEIIDNLNKQSDNLSAEMTLRALALEKFGKPASAENGIVLIDSFLTIIGFDAEDFRIVDGSGVSHYNLITADLLSGILKYFFFEKPKLYDVLKNSFPAAGVDGTLKRRMKEGPASQNVCAKTGTLSGVSSLSGYLQTKNGHDIAFSILMQNYVGSARKAHYFQDAICTLLCGIDEK